jgi:hypothetical protein
MLLVLVQLRIHKEDNMADTNTEIQVWFDTPDGVRRSMNALDEAGVQQIIADLHEDENRRQLLAQTVGLSVPPHEYNFSYTKITTTTEEVDL